MRDILGCVRTALRHVGCSVDEARLNAAHGDGDGENDRKERFHGTKVFVAARSYALIRSFIAGGLPILVCKRRLMPMTQKMRIEVAGSERSTPPRPGIVAGPALVASTRSASWIASSMSCVTKRVASFSLCQIAHKLA